MHFEKKSIQKLATSAFNKICSSNKEFVLSNLGTFIELLRKVQ